MQDTETIAGVAEDQEFSLADLSDLDVSEIEEIRFEQLPAGIYTFRGANADLGEGTNRDDEKIFYFEGNFEVVEVKQLLESGVDPESIVGKTHRERRTIERTEPETGIGRIRAFVSDAGLDSRGKLGEVVKRLVGHEFAAKIVKRKNKDDPSIEYANIQFERKK